MSAERLQIIREAMESLASMPRAAREEKREPRPVFGCRQQVRAAVPVSWVEHRRAVTQAAIAFLNSSGRGVQVIDKEARIRRYRLGGKVEPMLAEEMIRYAIEHGFDAERATNGGSDGAA